MHWSRQVWHEHNKNEEAVLDRTEVIVILCVTSIVGQAFYTQFVEVIKLITVVTGQCGELAGCR